MKRLVMLLFIIIILLSSCLDKEKESMEEETNNHNENIEYKINVSAFNANYNSVATHEEFIFFIDFKNRYINRINMDGTNPKIILKNKSSVVHYYEGKLYFVEIKDGVNCLSSVNIDGSNYKVLYDDKNVRNFVTYNEDIYMNVYAIEYDKDGFLEQGFLRYNLKDGSVDSFDSVTYKSHCAGLSLINDKIYYNIDNLREYDIISNTTKDNQVYFSNLLQEDNNNMYTFGDYSIYKINMYDVGDYEVILNIDEKDYIIRKIHVTNDLIFLTYSYNYRFRSEKKVFVDAIDKDGNNQKRIYEFDYSTLGHYPFDELYVIEDKLLVVSSDPEYPIFKMFDFEGNELWSLFQ